MSLFPFSFGLWVMVELVACVACWTRFFRQTLVMWPGSPQYKEKLFTHWHCFFCFVNGLNYVLSICMGSTLGEDMLCLDRNMGGMNCLNVGGHFQRFSCWCSKSRLSQHIVYTIAWFKVIRSNMVNKRSSFS
jgi:hypothetical protein